jgi:hypothetical protein
LCSTGPSPVGQGRTVPKIWFDDEVAATYDEDSADRFAPTLLESTVAFLFTSDSVQHVSVWEKPA